tara:strand:- start:46934 stop:47704 length:771 start_codon:yes stop_codon:yes gene_type:complete
MKLGIIQGRLTPPTEGFQECPIDWKKEFLILKELNLNHIEWIVTSKYFNVNPIFYEDVSQYPIFAICADNLINEKITDSIYLENNLAPICEAAQKNNIKHVTIPLLEKSSMKEKETREKFCGLIKKYAESFPKLNFLFEAELEAPRLLEIVSLADNFFITYDTGNITSCGFDHEDYLSLVFDKIKNVHLKDRTFNARTVIPSSGDTNFKQIFNFLKEKSYNGMYTLQTAREIYGNEIETIKAHKRTLEGIYNEKRI